MNQLEITFETSAQKGAGLGRVHQSRERRNRLTAQQKRGGQKPNANQSASLGLLTTELSYRRE
jgi:hypothetical protein